MSSGVNGILVKYISPLSCVYADNERLMCDPRRRLSVIMAWGISKSHKTRRKTGFVEAGYAKKRLLHVRIVHPAALHRWT